MATQTYLTKTDLLVRGWNKKSIQYFLTSADKSIKHVSKSLPTKLYNLNRVIRIENSQQFKASNQWKSRNIKNGGGHNEINNFKQQIPFFEQELLYKQSCEHWYISKELFYLEHKHFNVKVELPNYKICDRDFLHRISIEYLKFLYDQNQKNKIHNTHIAKEKSIDLQISFYQKTSNVYPYLSKKCEFFIARLLF